MLNILENTDLREFDHNSEEYLKILISAMDYAYKDRLNILEIQIFLSASRFTHIKNMLTTYIGKYWKRNNLLKQINIVEGEETTHFSILDKWAML